VTAETLLQIAAAAILAPSAENKHTFVIDIGTDTISLLATPEFRGAPYHRRVLQLMAIGAALENIRVAALALSCSSERALFPNGIDAAEIAIVRLIGTAREGERELAACIPDRHTNRRPIFGGQTLSIEERERLHREIGDIDGVDLTWLNAPEARARTLRLMWLAESERFFEESLHAELFSNIRFDLGWENASDEGLAPGSLEIESFARPVFRSLRSWAVMKPLRSLGIHRALGFRAAYLPCRLAPDLAVLTTDLDALSGAPLVGQALERLWLHATSKGLAMQPFAAPALLALDGYTAVRNSVRLKLQSGWRELLSRGTPLIVFRLGRAAAPTIVNTRRTLEGYLLRHRNGG
jgi:hypothetical protein